MLWVEVDRGDTKSRSGTWNGLDGRLYIDREKSQGLLGLGNKTNHMNKLDNVQE